MTKAQRARFIFYETAMSSLNKISYILAGLALFATAAGLSLTATGTAFQYSGTFSQSLPGALNFWLAYVLFVVPGALLVAYGAGSNIAHFVSQVIAVIAGIEPRTRRLLWILLACAAVLFAQIGYGTITLGFPLTDDEVVARWGGQILASGQLGVLPSPAENANPQRFTTPLQDGRITSFEWLGGQLVWMIGEMTGKAVTLFAIFAGLTLVAVGLCAEGRHGKGRGWLAILLFLSSPMAVSLSVLTHTHTIARAFVAFAMLAFVMSMRGNRGLWPFLFGLAFGAAVLCRPVESVFLIAPLGIALIWDARRFEPAAVSRLLWVLAGGIGPLLILLWYQWAITGDPFSIPRWAPEATGEGLSEISVLERFGYNLSHNLMMLVLWFAGPIGLLLVSAGVGYDRTTKLLATGIGLLLLVALAHQTTGIHMVGPMNYMETIPALVIIAVAGYLRLKNWWLSQAVTPTWLPASLLVALVISGSWFNVHSLSALHRQAELHAGVFGAVEAQLDAHGAERAMIFAPRYFFVWANIPALRSIGTYVYDWPRQRPDGSNRALFLVGKRDSAQLQDALATWPDRRPFVLKVEEQAPWIRLVELGSGERNSSQ